MTHLKVGCPFLILLATGYSCRVLVLQKPLLGIQGLPELLGHLWMLLSPGLILREPASAYLRVCVVPGK